MGATEYVKETQAELKRVSWPTRKQVAVSTLAVVIVSLAMSFLLGVFDFVFSSALGKILVTSESSSVVAPKEDGIETKGTGSGSSSLPVFPTPGNGATEPNMIIPTLPKSTSF